MPKPISGLRKLTVSVYVDALDLAQAKESAWAWFKQGDVPMWRYGFLATTPTSADTIAVALQKEIDAENAHA